MNKLAIAQAFSNGEFANCYPYIKDSTFWNTPGQQYLSGRNAILEFCEKVMDYFNAVEKNFYIHQTIENETSVSINGTAEFFNNKKLVSRISSCDVYEFNSQNQLISIYSYCISENENIKPHSMEVLYKTGFSSMIATLVF
ncbi:hypothetical protein [Sphingobacterium hungaricum]